MTVYTDKKGGMVHMQKDYQDVDTVRNRIRQLAKSYIPEWKFDEQNPDIGSVIAMIYAEQMEQNIGRFHQMVDKFHIEFVNMMGISLMAARPSNSVVIMRMMSDTAEGSMIAKGTRLLGEEEVEESIVFETLHDIYITGLKFTDVFQIAGKKGKIQILSPEDSIHLFDFSDCGIVENKLIIYHKTLFDVDNEIIFLRFYPSHSEENLNQRFVNREAFRFSYFSADGQREFEQVEYRDNVIQLKQQRKPISVYLEQESYTAIVLEALNPIQESIEIKDVALSVSGRQEQAKFVCNQIRDLDYDIFKPFGEELALYSECYIGNDVIFSKAGSLITITFELLMEENYVGLTKKQEEEKLKVIKRKPRTISYDMGAEAFIQEISLEYYNGKGFKKLDCNSEIGGLFYAPEKGKYEISFICPKDFESFRVLGNEGKCIRMQIQRADNCYLHPCVHHYPIIKDLELSYSFQNNYVQPDALWRISGNQKINLTQKLRRQQSFSGFLPLPYEGNALYLGFDKKPEQGPISLFFQMDEDIDINPFNIQYEYSSTQGFKTLKVIDNTNRLAGSGILLFMPPEDYSAVEIEGKRRYYIRIRNSNETFSDDKIYHPIIRHIETNAVAVQNIETLEEEEFYIDELEANMYFPLNARNVLCCEVYVNEIYKYTPAQIKAMAADERITTRVEYNYLGELTDFYVLWNEVENFDNSTIEDRHYVIDRMNNTIIFGDGVNIMIPNYMNGVAFTVKTVCCSGEKGNVNEGSINKAVSNLLFVDDIQNPIRGYGGTDMETIDKALQRGAAILSNHRRLVSELDYVREIKAYSENVDKVKCICGDDGRLSLVLLMKDFEKGSYSFRHIRNGLRRHLLQECEMTIGEEDLYITEPVFLKISVDVWIEIDEIDEMFRIRTMLLEHIYSFFHPVKTESGNGYMIGMLPGKQQIVNMIHAIKFNGRMERYVVTASYTDSKGVHETDLNRMRKNPFVICMNGTHSIHIAEWRSRC